MALVLSIYALPNTQTWIYMRSLHFQSWRFVYRQLFILRMENRFYRQTYSWGFFGILYRPTTYLLRYSLYLHRWKPLVLESRLCRRRSVRRELVPGIRENFLFSKSTSRTLYSTTRDSAVVQQRYDWSDRGRSEWHVGSINFSALWCRLIFVDIFHWQAGNSSNGYRKSSLQRLCGIELYNPDNIFPASKLWSLSLISWD